MENSEFLMIPHERVGALIGKNGSTKREIEKSTETHLRINSQEGEIEIIQKGAPFRFLKALKIVKAIGRGFSPEHAYRLLDDESIFELIELKEVLGKNESLLKTKKGRIIGEKGKAREEIEIETGANISVYGKTIGIIGKQDQVDKAMHAVNMLLHGAKHGTVYNTLKRKDFEEKFEL